MKTVVFLALFALINFAIISCKDEKTSGDTQNSATMNLTDTTGQNDTATLKGEELSAAISKIPYEHVTNNADARKWHEAYVAKITASTPSPGNESRPCFDTTMIITQIALFDDVSKELRKLSPKKVKFVIALRDSKSTVLIQVRLMNNTYIYFDMGKPKALRASSVEYSFCPPPSGCTLEEAP